MVIHPDVSRQRGAVGEHRIVADLTIVSDVYVRHDPVAITDPRDAAAALGTPVDGAILANGVLITDFETCRLIAIFLVLRRFSDGRERVDLITATHSRRSLNNGVGTYPAPGANLDIRADDAERTDLDIRAETGALMNDRRGVNHSYVLKGAHDLGAGNHLPADAGFGDELPDSPNLPRQPRLEG